MKKIIIGAFLLPCGAAAMSPGFNHYMRTVLALGGVERYSAAFKRMSDGALCYQILPIEKHVAQHSRAVALSESEILQRAGVLFEMERKGLYKIMPSMDNSRYYYEVWCEVCSCFGLHGSDSDLIECRCADDSAYTIHSLVRVVNGVVYIDPGCRHLSHGMMRFALFYMGARLKHHDEEIKTLLCSDQLSAETRDCYDLFSERRAHAVAFSALNCAWCAKQVCDTGVLRVCLSDRETSQLAQHLVICVAWLHEIRPIVVERVLCSYHAREKIELVSEAL